MTLKNKINLSLPAQILEHKTWVGLVAFSILIICLIVFVIEPLFIGIKNNSEDLIFQRQQFTSLKTKIKNLQEFKVFSQSRRKNLDKIDKLFINSDMPVEFISFLESVSQDCQIPIKISSLPSKREKEDPWPSLNFQLSSFGALPEFLRFLEKLENSPYLITIQNVNIRKFMEQGALPGDVNINLSIKVYAKANQIQ